jgi:hypothetical protein
MCASRSSPELFLRFDDPVEGEAVLIRDGVRKKG